MKFKFCGDLDCPDWVLVQISALSKLSSIKIRRLCTEIIKDIASKEIDFEKIEKLTTDSKFDNDDIKSCIAALHFILSSSAKYSVEYDTLTDELIQLGLPKELSSSLCKVLYENFDQLQNELKSQSLRTSRLVGVKCEIESDFSSNEHKVKAPVLKLQLQKESCQKETSHCFYVTPDKLANLIYELKQAQQLINEITH